MTPEPTPDRWLLKRAGADAEEISAAAASAMIAERPDAVGDLYGGGLVWQEPDADSYSGSTFVMLTPIWDSQ